VYTKEHIVNDHIKLVYICSNDNVCTVIGDLPALSWCFDKGDELSVSESRLCYSRRFTINIKGSTVEVVIEGAEVLGELKSISFVAYGVKGDMNPEVLYKAVSEYVINICSNTIGKSLPSVADIG